MSLRLLPSTFHVVFLTPSVTRRRRERKSEKRWKGDERAEMSGDGKDRRVDWTGEGVKIKDPG